MVKSAVTQWSTTESSNRDVGGHDVSEGCFPSGINDAIREMMAQIAKRDLELLKLDGVGSVSQGYSARLQSITNVSLGSNQMLYFTSANQAAATPVTPYARTFLDDADAAAARTTLGLGDAAVQNVVASNLIDTNESDSRPTTALAVKTLNKTIMTDNMFQSAGQAITSGGLLTLPHGLSAQPVLFSFYLKCLTAERDWQVGDEVVVSIAGDANQVNSVYSDATNVYVRFSNESSAFRFTNKSNGTPRDITNSFWEFYVRAWA